MMAAWVSKSPAANSDILQHDTLSKLRESLSDGNICARQKGEQQMSTSFKGILRMRYEERETLVARRSIPRKCSLPDQLGYQRAGK